MVWRADQTQSTRASGEIWPSGDHLLWRSTPACQEYQEQRGIELPWVWLNTFCSCKRSALFLCLGFLHSSMDLRCDMWSNVLNVSELHCLWIMISVDHLPLLFAAKQSALLILAATSSSSRKFSIVNFQLRHCCGASVARKGSMWLSLFQLQRISS